MSQFSELMGDASRVVNSVLGAPCLYKKINGDRVKNVNIIVDKNQPIMNDFGIIAGYRVEASILKSEIPVVKVYDEFVDECGDTYRINMMIKETSSKWYVDVIKI